MAYGVTELCQQWSRWRIGVWWHQAITWTNVYLYHHRSLVAFTFLQFIRKCLAQEPLQINSNEKFSLKPHLSSSPCNHVHWHPQSGRCANPRCRIYFWNVSSIIIMTNWWFRASWIRHIFLAAITGTVILIPYLLSQVTTTHCPIMFSA